MSLFPIISPGVLVVPVGIQFVAATSNSDDETNYTFSSHGIGTANADRKVVICIMQCDNDISGVTVGGSACTEAVHADNNNNDCEIWYRNNFSSGTSADIIVSTGGSNSACEIVVYALTGAADSPTNTYIDVSGNPTSSAIVAAKGAAVIGCACLKDRKSVV